MKSNVFKLAVLAILAAAAMTAGAVTTTFPVSASIAQVCSVSATALAFGAYDPVTANVSTALPGSSTLTVQCTKGSQGSDGTAPKVTIGLNFGLNATASPRVMKNGTDSLNYDLYLPALATGEYTSCAAHTTVWDTTTNVLSPNTAFWSTGAAHSISVCGLVPAGQSPTGLGVGTYTDTVTVQLNF